MPPESGMTYRPVSLEGDSARAQEASQDGSPHPAVQGWRATPVTLEFHGPLRASRHNLDTRAVSNTWVISDIYLLGSPLHLSSLTQVSGKESKCVIYWVPISPYIIMSPKHQNC